FLRDRGIDNQVDPTPHGDWEVWILDDDNIESSRALFERFSRDENDPMFSETSHVVAHHKQDESEPASKRTRMIDARTIFYAPPVPLGPLSLVLIAISIGVTLFTEFGKVDHLTRILSISQFPAAIGHIHWDRILPEVRHGQVWRLFTPMFLHFDILHIFFNMLWLRDLGSMIEARRGPWFMLLLTLVLAGTSNVGQYLVSGPHFGGMSGVVYGLLGYIWMQGRFNPASRLSLQPQTVTFMIVWFFICLAGLVGHIANTAHGVGLVVGVAWGLLDARVRVALRRY
ncbi:MAG: rhomboid family intramembrane serine protease, partial [Solirubrobacterales bacterium]